MPLSPSQQEPPASSQGRLKGLALLPVACLFFVQCAAAGTPDKSPAVAEGGGAEQEGWLLRGQSTFVTQAQPGFPAKYSGPNSLLQGDNARETLTFDLCFGFRPWSGAEIYLNPEFFQGFGLSETHGIAAFPNGEAYKVGKRIGDVFLPHLFLRQTFGFGGGQDTVEGGLLQMAGKVDVNRLTVTVGRLGLTDQFDTNTYAHDGRGQFMNWALIDAGAFDYAADAMGFTQGLTVELNQKDWAVRAGSFMVPQRSNGVAFDEDIFKAWQEVLELEGRYALGEHPGKIKILGWVEQADMGSYSQALADPTLNLDITKTRRYRIQSGVVLNLEQEIHKDLGAFLRASWRDGRSEVWQFTDIDRSLSAGLSLKGTSWGREGDTLGLACILDGLGPYSKAYFEAGGLGTLVGDGRLNYGLESIMETYYDATLCKGVHLAFDFQLVTNPAYNKDRGPVPVFSGRLHFEF